MSDLKRIYRPRQTIAAELSQEFDSERIGALAEELDAAIVAQSSPRRFQQDPYVRFRDSDWVRNLLDSALLVTAADFGNIQLFDSSRRLLKVVAHRGFQP